MATSIDFCFKTKYACYCAYDRLYVAFNLLFLGSSPSGKVVSHEPPLPSEITAFEPPLPLGISNDLPWGGGGYGYFLEPHNVKVNVVKTIYCQCNSIFLRQKKKLQYSSLDWPESGLSGLKNIWPVIMTGDLLSIIFSPNNEYWVSFAL